MGKRYKLLAFFTLTFLLLFLSACQGVEPTVGEEQKGGELKTGQEDSPSGSAKEGEASDGEETAYFVTDDMGEAIRFEKVPESVVSLQPSNTEILFALGLGDKIVGVTQFDTYPEEAKNIERVSDSVNIDAERIIELNPDVVFAYTVGEKESIRPLLDAGLTVFVIRSASSFEDVYGDIMQIAEVMGVKERGEELVNQIKGQLETVAEKVKDVSPKSVYLEISPAPDLYTPGQNTFQHEILTRAGVINAFGDLEGWKKISEEEIISRDPDIVATTVHHGPDPVQEIKDRPGWHQLKAVQNGEVYLLDDVIMTRPGPRIGEAVELVAKMAYPEQFN